MHVVIIADVTLIFFLRPPMGRVKERSHSLSSYHSSTTNSRLSANDRDDVAEILDLKYVVVSALLRTRRF